MRKILVVLAMALLLSACNKRTEEERQYLLQGAWVLSHSESPMGVKCDFSMEGNGTFCLVYDGDSMLYECRIMQTSAGMVILPTEKCDVTLIDKGGGEFLYLEHGDPHPLNLVGDTLLTIQRMGALYTWKREDQLYREWGSEISHIIINEFESDNTDNAQRYVLSYIIREQERTIQWFGYFSVFIVLLALIAVHLAIVSRRDKRRLQLQLQQIQEVQEYRPKALKKVVENIEKDFFSSDAYLLLQQRMAEGNYLNKQDWKEVEQQLQTVYPGFSSQLRSLYPLSELEYQVCLLIKLRIPTKDIAAVLARDVSTISTVRSRLYKKVFGHKGGAKEWDDFILSMGA